MRVKHFLFFLVRLEHIRSLAFVRKGSQLDDTRFCSILHFFCLECKTNIIILLNYYFFTGKVRNYRPGTTQSYDPKTRCCNSSMMMFRPTSTRTSLNAYYAHYFMRQVLYRCQKTGRLVHLTFSVKYPSDFYATSTI